ncbi:MAG: YraN family protein [Bacteroidales bacterium]|nr:YraN family protein [Bacteroidales bacterium]
MKSKTQKGRQGEEVAKLFLENKGYKILETNWRFDHKEIDIIALKDKEIVFVEVKARKNSRFGEPEEAVDEKKQQRLIEAAEAYLSGNDMDFEARFDVISIINNTEIKHFPYAFYPSF